MPLQDKPTIPYLCRNKSTMALVEQAATTSKIHRPDSVTKPGL
jgi:hypothetical protein